MTAPITLPLGHARELYCMMRARGKSRAYALAKAAEVDAAQDCDRCACCKQPLDPEAVNQIRRYMDERGVAQYILAHNICPVRSRP